MTRHEATGVIQAFAGQRPRWGANVYIAPTAVLLGDVEIGDGASIWFGAVLRGDLAPIRIGSGTAVQDSCVVHAAFDVPTVVGANVVIGHAALLEGCSVEDGAVVGMGSIVLQGARVGAGSMVAAGSVVPENRHIAAGMLAAGVPATEKKAIAGASKEWIESAAAEYHALRDRYLSGA